MAAGAFERELPEAFDCLVVFLPDPVAGPEEGAGPGPRGPTLHPPPGTGASSLGADAAGPHTTDREARALEARAASAGVWIVLGAAALALLLALWTLGLDSHRG